MLFPSRRSWLATSKVYNKHGSLLNSGEDLLSLDGIYLEYVEARGSLA
jgi:hypothetical protein